MLLAAAIAVPSFVRSYRGAKLRTSARSIVMSHRYARSMAVLRQTPVAALFDKNRGEIEVVSLASSAAFDDRSKFLDERSQKTGVESVDNANPAGGPPAEAAPAPTVQSELVRPLAEGVKIAEFDSEQGAQEFKGVYWVNYYPNGMSDEFTVRLEDEYHKTATVSVDPLSGRAKVEYE